MVEESKLVSVIIPAYNAAKTIVQTLDSVFAQTHKNLEIILIDDGSTDNSLEVLIPYQKKIKILSTENKGVSSARNLGFANAKGEYIQYLDADDLLMPEKIKTQIRVLINNNADVAYGDWEKFIVEKKQIIVKEKIERQIQGDVEIALFTDFWCPPAAILYSRRVCERLLWNENLPVIQDARYFLDAAIMKFKFVYTPGIGARYRVAQAKSLSQNSDFNFVKDLYANTCQVCNIWSADFLTQPVKKAAIVNSLRHCINRLSVMDKQLAKQATKLLLTLEPDYLPPEKGALRSLSKMFGYKNAETIAGLKRSLRK